MVSDLGETSGFVAGEFDTAVTLHKIAREAPTGDIVGFLPECVKRLKRTGPARIVNVVLQGQWETKTGL